MKPTPRGYAPAPGYLSQVLGKSSTFNDPEALEEHASLAAEVKYRDLRWQEFLVGSGAQQSDAEKAVGSPAPTGGGSTTTTKRTTTTSSSNKPLRRGV